MKLTVVRSYSSRCLVGLSIALCVLFSAQSVADPAFWRVKSDAATIYLFGSIHIADKSIYPLNPVIEKAFAGSDVLVVEVDETQADQLKLNELLLKKGFYPPPETIKDHVSKETMKLLMDFLSKTGVPYATVARMRPGIVAITLTVARIMQLGFSPELGIDRYFMNKARVLGKTIEQLETAEEQMELLLGLSNEDLLLKHTVISLNEMDSVFDEIMTAWKSGDTKVLETVMLTDPVKEYPEFESLMVRMFDQRNVSMTQGIVKRLQQKKTYFVVVGAGHLVGEKGIVSLLSRQGYKVERL